VSDHFAAAVEATALLEWQRCRAREPSIPNTEDVRSAFVVGFSIGVHHGMKIDVKGIAQKIASEFAPSQDKPK
jgi:hypothetical protein